MNVEEWKNITIGECLKTLTDYTANGSFESLKKNVIYYSEYEYAVLVRTTDLGKFIFIPERFTDKKGYKYLRKTSLFGGEIVIANVGSVGKVYRVPEYGQLMTLAPNMYLLKFNQTISDEFIFQYLSSYLFRKKLFENIASTTLQAINKDNLRNISLSIPKNYLEQTQIAAVLSLIDRAIEQTEAIIAKQQRIKTGLMQDLLTKGIDEDGNVRSEATHEFKDSPLGRIPAEWEVKTLNKVASLQRGHDIREIDLIPGNCPVIASSGIIGFHKFSTSSAPNVVVGRKGSIGNVHYIDSDFWAHDTSLFVTNFFGNHEKYVYYLFSNLKLERFGTKSGSPSLNRNDIHPLLVGIPNSTEQRKIVRVLSECDKSLTGFSEELEKNKRRKTGLMQDLLTGNVRVTALLNDRAKTSL